MYFYPKMLQPRNKSVVCIIKYCKRLKLSVYRYMPQELIEFTAFHLTECTRALGLTTVCLNLQGTKNQRKMIFAIVVVFHLTTALTFLHIQSQ